MTQQQLEDEMDKDPKNWRWGCFYYNPQDERLFVPKKNPAFGSTINCANPKAYLIFLPVLFMVILVTVVVIFDK